MRYLLAFASLLVYSTIAGQDTINVVRRIAFYDFDKQTVFHSWTLYEIRDKSNSFVPKAKIKSKTIRFTQDSVFATFKQKMYAGTWSYENNILILRLLPKTRRFDYNVSSRGPDYICFSYKEKKRRIECFKLVN